jgi:hypothetical protein
MTKRSYRLEGGEYHNTHQSVTLDANGDPPPWLHMVDPIGSGDCALVTAVWYTPHIYERQQRPAQPGGPLVWYYRAWKPTDPPSPPE